LNLSFIKKKLSLLSFGSSNDADMFPGLSDAASITV